MAVLMRAIIILLCSATLASAAHAEQLPQAKQPPAQAAKPVLDPHEPIPGMLDPRIRTFPYNPNVTVRVTTPGLTPMRLVFAPGTEQIATAGALVATTGDQKNQPVDWSASKLGATLVLQPLHEDIPPSLLFITTSSAAGPNGERQENNYVVELHLGTGDITDPNDKSAYAQVVFTYPKVEAADAADIRARNARMVTNGKANTSLTQARFAAPRQWHYSKLGAGCSSLTPSGWNWISDDGNQTSLLFPPHMAGSSIFSREDDDDKDESLITPIPTTTKVGTLEVLPGVYKQLVLRRGNKVCALRADAYDPIGTQPGGGSGTISPDVIRVRSTRR